MVSIEDIEDPFALPSDSKVTKRGQLITGGRYRLPNRDGSHKPYGFMRVSNLISAYSDQFGLRMWEIEQTLRGTVMSQELYDKLNSMVLSGALDEMTKEERKHWFSDYVEHAKDAAHANEGSKFGNQRHAMVEIHEAGLPTHHASPDTRLHLALYSSAMRRNSLRAIKNMQERRVLISSLEAIGTLDNVVLDELDVVHRVADLKTQKRFWTFLEVAAQLATYSRGEAMWEPGTGDDPTVGRWVDMPVSLDQKIGFVAWMPREHPSGEPAVDIYECDLEAGWKTAQRAYEVVKDRAAAKSTKNPRMWLRECRKPDDIERYAARFALVETAAEGRALVAEAKEKGAWCDILAEEAKRAANRVLIAP